MLINSIDKDTLVEQLRRLGDLLIGDAWELLQLGDEVAHLRAVLKRDLGRHVSHGAPLQARPRHAGQTRQREPGRG